MANLLSGAIGHLAKALKTNAGATVTYKRGGATVSVQATKGQTQFEQDDQGAMLRWESVDWLIDTADLILSGAVTTPQRGDVIAETIGAATVTYEVLGDGNEPCFRYSDPHRKKLRIHTKETFNR